MLEYEILPNPNFMFRKKVEEAIKENDGYCCCSLFKDEDTKCICKDFLRAFLRHFIPCMFSTSELLPCPLWHL